MHTYDSYKDSGIDWLGEIPSHWEVRRLGNWFEERREKVSDKDYAPLSVTKNGIVPQLENAAKSNDGDNRKLVKAGDFVINSRSDRKGSSGLSSFDGSVSLINIVLKPRNIFGNFTEYLLKSNSFIEEFYRNGHGIVADLWTTRFEEMKFINLALPPLHEQEAIARFLDDKCAKIDELVAIKEQQIDKLKELRQVKIHQAVTKGIKSNAEMKDSGIDWIGEIPKHWEVKRLKYLFRILKRIAGKIGLDVLSITQKGIKVKDITSGEGQLAMDYSKYQYAYKGDFAMNHMDLLTGWVDISNYNGVISPDYRVFELINKNNNSNYFLNLLQDCYRNKTFYAHGQGVSMFGRWRFPTENFNNFFFPIPPLSEQEAIVAYLDQETNKIDQAIAQREAQIEKLKAYKQSLINEVVTGKIRVA